jgi:septal ring factor EnvC (AmiA/AmiB activator)
MSTHPRFYFPALVLMSAALAWGCTRPPAAAVDDGKARALEARVAKLEQDVKAVAAARDALQQKLAAADERASQLEAKAAAAELDRDAVRAGLKTRTAERDAALTQFDSFRKNLRELLGQADTTAAGLSAPAVTTISLPPVLRGRL